MYQNQPVAALRLLPFVIVDSVTFDPYVGSIVKADMRIRKVGGAWTQPTNDPAKIDSQEGAWELQLEQAEVDTAGFLAYRVIKGGVKTLIDYEPIIPSIESEVWDSLVANHQVANSFGEQCGRPIAAVVADVGNTASTFKTNLTQVNANYWKDCWVCFLSGALQNQVHKVLSFDAGTKFLTVVNPFTAAPAGTDRFVLVNK